MNQRFRAARLLVVGDDVAVEESLLPVLRQAGFERIDNTSDIATAGVLCSTLRPDLVIVDARSAAGQWPTVFTRLLVSLEGSLAASLALVARTTSGVRETAAVLEVPFSNEDLLLRVTACWHWLVTDSNPRAISRFWKQRSGSAVAHAHGSHFGGAEKRNELGGLGSHRPSASRHRASDQCRNHPDATAQCRRNLCSNEIIPVVQPPPTGRVRSTERGHSNDGDNSRRTRRYSRQNPAPVGSAPCRRTHFRRRNAVADVSMKRFRRRGPGGTRVLERADCFKYGGRRHPKRVLPSNITIRYVPLVEM